jgi:hypothetical protein
MSGRASECAGRGRRSYNVPPKLFEIPGLRCSFRHEQLNHIVGDDGLDDTNAKNDARMRHSLLLDFVLGSNCGIVQHDLGRDIVRITSSTIGS